MAKPTTLTQLRSFIGMINFYRSMFPRRAHVLAPLTDLMKVDPRTFLQHWTPVHDQAFEAAKAMLAQATLLNFPDPNKTFVVRTDASDYQLGAVILQDDKPIAFYSRKLSKSQMKYTTIEKELLSILEVFQEFRCYLWGRDIIIETDHKNLIYPKAQSQRVQNWQMLIADFAPREWRHRPGYLNIEPDTLSRYPIVEKKQGAASAATEDTDEEANFELCMINYPDDVNRFPCVFSDIQAAQQTDQQIMQWLNLSPMFAMQTFHGVDLVCKLSQNNEWKIVLPEALIDDTMEWYHHVLGHAGTNSMINSIGRFFYFYKLHDRIEDYVARCESCQRNKNPGVPVGELPPRNETAVPFEDCAVDLIGPWKVDLPALGKDAFVEFSALTVIDIATDLPVVVRIDDRTSRHVALKFDNNYLAFYPRPVRVIHDQGSEFIGPEFRALLATNGIKDVCTTSKNPQANSVVERCHHTIGNMMRTHIRETDILDFDSVFDWIDSILAGVNFALRSMVNRTFGASPGALVFGRDMMLNIPMLVDFNLIRQRRQAIIDDNNRRENLRRRFRDYSPGDQVLIRVYNPSTLQERFIGPFTIHQVHVNGTVTIMRNPNVYERINIRRLHPFRA
jgi:hypothetical protein